MLFDHLSECELIRTQLGNTQLRTTGHKNRRLRGTESKCFLPRINYWHDLIQEFLLGGGGGGGVGGNN